MTINPAVVLAAFIALKLTGSIDWSWWWVLSPLWLVLVLHAISYLMDEVME